MTTLRSVVLVALASAAIAHDAHAQDAQAQPPSTRPVAPRLDAATRARLQRDLPLATQTPAAQPTTISRERLSTVLGGSRAATLRVVRAGGVSDLAGSAASVSIAPGEFVFRKMGDSASRSLPPGNLSTGGEWQRDPDLGARAATLTMPYRWYTLDSAGVERLLIPYFIIMGGGLTYDVASRSYRGVALVGVEDSLHPGEGPVALARPLRMQLTTTRGGTVDPLQLAIAHTSLDYERVTITSDDSTDVRIRTGADPAGIVVPVPVRSMTVSLVAQQQSLPALGLATTDISVSLPRGYARTDSATVSFRSTGAPVRPASVRVSGADASTVRLRSGMPGADTVRAFIDGVLAGETVVTFAPPWAFLAATLVGIVLGGTARFVGAKRRKRVRALGWDIVKGAPFGILAAAASAVGLDWLQLRIDDPGTWIAIMITAALGAWLATRLLQRAVPAA